VGCFPGGTSPYGVEELSGNIWEWTRSHLKSYLYRPDDGRENLDAPDDVPRVVRGGASRVIRSSVRAAKRGRDSPNVRDDGSGFRVVVSPFSSGL
jgi:formylglycine-generating enzyme required for sulfatase activity